MLYGIIIGFKHVTVHRNGHSIAKAEYVARVHEDYDVPLPEIAQAIGDRNATVVRLYHGLKSAPTGSECSCF